MNAYKNRIEFDTTIDKMNFILMLFGVSVLIYAAIIIVGTGHIVASIDRSIVFVISYIKFLQISADKHKSNPSDVI